MVLHIFVSQYKYSNFIRFKLNFEVIKRNDIFQIQILCYITKKL